MGVPGSTVRLRTIPTAYITFPCPHKESGFIGGTLSLVTRVCIGIISYTNLYRLSSVNRDAVLARHWQLRLSMRRSTPIYCNKYRRPLPSTSRCITLPCQFPSRIPHGCLREILLRTDKCSRLGPFFATCCISPTDFWFITHRCRLRQYTV